MIRTAGWFTAVVMLALLLLAPHPAHTDPGPQPVRTPRLGIEITP